MIIDLEAYNSRLDSAAVNITLTPAEFAEMIITIDAARDLIQDSSTEKALLDLCNKLKAGAARLTDQPTRKGD